MRSAPSRFAGFFVRPFIFPLRSAVGAGWLVLTSLSFAVPVPFNVPAGRADRALLTFSQQGKIELLFSSDALKRAKSSAVEGTYEPDDALRLLLRGSGFVAQVNDAGKYSVIRAPVPAPGSIHGVLRNGDGSPAARVRVSILGTRKTVVTAATGAFDFEKISPGSYALVATASRYQPLQLGEAVVESGQTVTLAPFTLLAASDPTKLDPFLVLGVNDANRSYNRRGARFPPQTAIGNIDLPRTENDVLPYSVFNREQIARSGVVNLNEFLQRELLDSDATTRPPEQNPNPKEPSFSASSTNLRMRGYGAEETVILVNGRRLPEVATSGGGPPPPPDVNFIPMSLVERVEVLPISSAALYSGNPVGGVINIVLRPDIDATEITTTYTNATAGFDAPQASISFQHGESLLDGALRLRVAATFTRSQPATEAELGFIRANLGTRVPSFDPHRATPNIRTIDGSPLFATGTQSQTFVAPHADGTGGLAAFDPAKGVQNLALFDSPRGMAVSPESIDYPYGRKQRGMTYFGSATYDVQPWLQLGIDGTYSQTVVNRGYDVFAGDLTLDRSSPRNPFGRDIAISLNETAPLLGENYREARLAFYSGVLGLLLKLPDDWAVSLDTQYGHNTTQYRGLVGVDADRWQQLVDRGTYNPLRDTQVFGPPREFYEQALIYFGRPGKFVTVGDYDTLDSALRITNHTLTLPTGTGAISVGADYRLNRLSPYVYRPQFGDSSAAEVPTRYSGRTLERISVFGELQAPLLRPNWLPRGVRALEADVAARYTAASSSQETNLAPTAGFKVDLAAGFALRATIASANRFPTPDMSRLVKNFTAPSNGSGGEVVTTFIKDPVLNESYNVVASDALNQSLRTEAAVTRTAGVIFQRGHLHRVRASLDFSDTRKTSELSYLDAQDVLNEEASLPGRVVRNPITRRVESVFTGTFNLVSRHSQNWNASLDYTWTDFLAGRLEVYGRIAYFQRYDLQLQADSAPVDEIRNPNLSSLRLLQYRTNFGSGWSNRSFGLGWDGRYFHSRPLPVFERTAAGPNRVAEYWEFDGFVEGDLTRLLALEKSRYNLHVQLRVNNVLDRAPPRYANDASSAGVQSYGDWRGRTYSVSVTATF